MVKNGGGGGGGGGVGWGVELVISCWRDWSHSDIGDGIEMDLVSYIQATMEP